MTVDDYGKAKFYVCEFVDSACNPRIVHGWSSVLKLRNATEGKVKFRAFHTYEGAEQALLKLRNLR